MLHIYYETFVVIACIMMLLFVLGWRKNASFEYMFTFTIVPLVNLGYSWLYSAKTLQEALMAQKLVYVGGCFLHLFLLFGIISLCNIKLHPVVRAAMLGCAFAMYSAVLMMDKNTLFYKKVTFVMVDGVGSMIKEYGPLHTVFYVYMIAIMVASVGVLVYAMVYRPDTSIRTLYVLIVLDVVSVTVFFGTRAISRAIGFEIETMPAFYIIAETVFLFLWIRNIPCILSTATIFMVVYR